MKKKETPIKDQIFPYEIDGKKFLFNKTAFDAEQKWSVEKDKEVLPGIGLLTLMEKEGAMTYQYPLTKEQIKQVIKILKTGKL